MRRTAFSVIELVITLAIAALAAGIAVPRFGGATARYRADYAAKKIVLDLARARTNARLTSLSQTCTFDTTNHRYVVTGTAGGLSAGYSVTLSESPYEAKIISADFGSGSRVVTFDRFGEVPSGGTMQIRVGTNTRTITLDAASAVARWQ